MKPKIFSAVFIVVSLCNAQEFTKAIEDNSYFIEEAYNQEEHVVQHIFTASTSHDQPSLGTSFTQEWPVFGHAHQLSFTIPYHTSLFASKDPKGIGDFLINYRYQLIDEEGFAVAPRFSLIIPSGDYKKEFGNGVVGAQINLPVSKRFSNEFVTHYNAGATIYPEAKNKYSTQTSTISEYFIGASGIYLANKSFNIMMEVLYTSSGSKINRSNELIVSPGVRWAIDIGELQIVPGLAFPFYFNTGNFSGQENSFFFYFSFEHIY